MSFIKTIFSVAGSLLLFVQLSYGQACTPTITCPPSVNICAGSSTSPASTGYAVATTGSGTVCLPPIISSSDYVQISGKCSGAQIITRTWTATSPSNPTATVSCVQTIRQGDFDLPYFSLCPPDVSVTSSNDDCSASVTWNYPVASDDCGIANLISNHNSGSIFPAGNTLVIYTAVDNCGNTATCSFTVSVACPGPGEQEYVNCGEDGVSSGNVHYSFNQCQANSITMTNADYSEFSSSINVAGDQDCMALSSTGLTRNIPEINIHSCTEGIGSSPGMCVGVDRDCAYEVDSDQAVRFMVTVDPLMSNGRLDHLEFYESAPATFGWIGGLTGDNDYPTRYAVRVLANGVEIFHQFDIPTSQDWSREFFDFSNNPAFEVSEYTWFEFQLTAYCSINGGSFYSIWDLDALSVNASCGEPSGSSTLSGGNISGGPFEYCEDDAPSYYIEENLISLSGNAGTNSQWIITDMEGVIIALPSTPYLVDFAAFSNENSQIWHLSYDPPITGFIMGYSIYSQLVGCYEISNPLTVSVRAGCSSASIIGVPGINGAVNIANDQANELFDFNLYPNPTEDQLNIDLEGLNEVLVNYELTDIYGSRIIYGEKEFDGNGAFDLNVTELTAGIYFMKIGNGTQAKVRKFVKL